MRIKVRYGVRGLLFVLVTIMALTSVLLTSSVQAATDVGLPLSAVANDTTGNSYDVVQSDSNGNGIANEIFYDASKSQYNIDYTAILNMTYVWNEYNVLKTEYQPLSTTYGVNWNDLALQGTFNIDFTFDTNYVNFDAADYANVAAIQAAYEASNAGQSGNFFDMMKVSAVNWNAATGDLTITLAFGTNAAKIPVPELEANEANFMSDIKLSLPEGALSVPQANFVAGQVFTTVGTISGGMDIYWEVPSTYSLTQTVGPASGTVTAANLNSEYNLADGITLATTVPIKMGATTLTTLPVGYVVHGGFPELPITFSPLEQPEVQIEMLKPAVADSPTSPAVTPPIVQKTVIMTAPNNGFRL